MVTHDLAYCYSFQGSTKIANIKGLTKILVRNFERLKSIHNLCNYTYDMSHKILAKEVYGKSSTSPDILSFF